MASSNTNAAAAELGHGIARALSTGLSATTWARRGDQWPRLDESSGLYEDDFLVEALVSAIGSIPGVRAI
jgi:hypothetical protein